MAHVAGSSSRTDVRLMYSNKDIGSSRSAGSDSSMLCTTDLSARPAVAIRHSVKP